MRRLSVVARVDTGARLEFLHSLFQRTATIAILDRTKMNPRISLSDLVARLESAEHAIAYFNKPLPEPPARRAPPTKRWTPCAIEIDLLNITDSSIRPERQIRAPVFTYRPCFSLDTRSRLAKWQRPEPHANFRRRSAGTKRISTRCFNAAAMRFSIAREWPS
jgi:hypothetical protein